MFIPLDIFHGIYHNDGKSNGKSGAIAKKHKNNILHRFYTNKIVDFTYILYHRTESEKEEVSICLE